MKRLFKKELYYLETKLYSIVLTPCLAMIFSLLLIVDSICPLGIEKSEIITIIAVALFFISFIFLESFIKGLKKPYECMHIKPYLTSNGKIFCKNYVCFQKDPNYVCPLYDRFPLKNDILTSTFDDDELYSLCYNNSILKDEA